MMSRASPVTRESRVYVGRQALADRQAAVGDRVMPVGRLLMHRFRIIDRGWNALRLQRRGETIAIGVLGQTDGVLRPDRGAAGGQTRHGHDIAEVPRIAFGDHIARDDLVLKNLQLLDQDGRLHGIEPRGEPEANIVVFVRTLAVDPDAAQRCGKFRIVGEDRPAIAKTAERLCREKTGRGRKPEGADAPTPVARAKALRGVIENKEPIALRDRGNRIMVGALPEQIDRDHGHRLEALLFRNSDPVS
jgi:hypothetical protein